MFLDMLSKTERGWFLELAVKAAEANGEVADEEVQMLHAFAAEMKIPCITSTDRELSVILKDFTDNSSTQAKKIVVFEIIGILFADSEFDDDEKKYLDEIIKAFNIDVKVKDEMIEDIQQYSALFNKICKNVIQ